MGSLFGCLACVGGCEGFLGDGFSSFGGFSFVVLTGWLGFD